MEVVNNKEEKPLEFYVEKFREMDPAEMAARCGLPYDGAARAVSMNLLGEKFIVTHPDYTVVGPSPLTNAERILFLRYLLDGRKAQPLGQYLTYREFPWGEVYLQQFTGRCIQRFAFSYGNKLALLDKIMEKLPAKRLSRSDCGWACGCRVHPFVLLNHKDTLGSEFTLAHEMGHAMHSYLSNKNQPTVYSGYVLFVAEVASTCNEALLMQYLLGRTEDKKRRAVLINYFLEQFRTTLYRQAMFAEFELKIHELAESGEALTAQRLCEIYLDINKTYYGPDVAADPEIALEWSRIPHFYRRFYVYQYATGFSAAMALSKRILEGGEEAVRDYLKFLSGGCSADPVSLLKTAGVDMSTPKPVNDALEFFGTLIGELEELLQ